VSKSAPDNNWLAIVLPLVAIVALVWAYL